MTQGIVLGIDGGGTYTRVVAADLEGRVLAFSKKGGAHPEKNENPKQNVQSAIADALLMANQPPEAVTCIVGGFAGLNKPADKEWATKYVKLPGINCPVIIVNDAEIAQYGAFLGSHGLLAIAGTGSTVLGKTETGKLLVERDFHYDSNASARYLSYAAIYEIISKNAGLEDQPLINRVLDYWHVVDIEELRLIASKGFSTNPVQAIKKLSQMGPIITEEASKGSDIAIRSCGKVAKSLVTGIELVSSNFSSTTVPLALVGGVANQPYIKALVLENLKTSKTQKIITYTEPKLSPPLGAVLYAYIEALRIGKDQNAVNQLILSEQSRDFN